MEQTANIPIKPHDLGIQTGYSTLTRDADAGLPDQVPEVTDVVGRLRAGEYYCVVAFDDGRGCHDEYCNLVDRELVKAAAEFVLVSDDVERDNLAFDIQRRVGRKMKEKEITKSMSAVLERQKNGFGK